MDDNETTVPDPIDAPAPAADVRFTEVESPVTATESASTAVITTRPPRDLRELRNRLQPSERTMRFVDEAVKFAFDTTDRLADTIAEELGIRARPVSPSPKPPEAP